MKRARSKMMRRSRGLSRASRRASVSGELMNAGVLNYLKYVTDSGVRLDARGDFNERWSLTRARGLFHNHIFPADNGSYDCTGWIDEDKFKGYLNGSLVPEGCCLLLNVEGLTWRNHAYHAAPDYSMYLRPSAVEYRHRLMDICEAERPDVRYGFFNALPPNSYGHIRRDETHRLYQAWQETCADADLVALSDSGWTGRD